MVNSHLCAHPGFFRPVLCSVSSYRFKHIYMFTKSQQALQFDGAYHSDFHIASVSTKWILLAVLNWMGSSGWVIDIWTHLLAHWCITVWFIFRWEVDWVYRSCTHLLVDDLESAQCVDALYVQVNGLIDWSGNASAEQPGKYLCNFVCLWELQKATYLSWNCQFVQVSWSNSVQMCT